MEGKEDHSESKPEVKPLTIQDRYIIPQTHSNYLD
jgi:hypothetical protein